MEKILVINSDRADGGANNQVRTYNLQTAIEGKYKLVQKV